MEPNDAVSGKGWRKEVKEWGLTLAAALVISFLIQNYAFAQVKVEQYSMSDTLLEGHRLIENKLIYRFAKPARGDIVIINSPESEFRLVKRIVGLPGEMLDIRDGTVWINGEQLEEGYVESPTFAGNISMPVQLTEDQYFVLGDNRLGSRDSRHTGPVQSSSLEGKAIFRIWPITEWKLLE